MKIKAKILNPYLQEPSNGVGKYRGINFEVFAKDFENAYIVFEGRSKFRITYKPSNLDGKKIWFFVCPNTSKLCRFIFYDERDFSFYTRHRFGLYDCQRRSKKFRYWDKLTGWGKEAYINERMTGFRKKTFKGKPTKWFARLAKRYPEVLSYNEIPPSIFKDRPFFIIYASRFAKYANSLKNWKGSFYAKQLISQGFEHKRTKVFFRIKAKDPDNVTLILSNENNKKKANSN